MASNATSTSVKVKAKIADTVKFKKTDGSLLLLENEVSWVASGGVSSKRFSCLYSDIKVQRISPDTSSKVQLQIVLQDDASNNFHFCNPKGRATQMQERNVIKDLLAELIPLHRQKATKDLEEKNKIFQERPELYQLYKELVVSNIITAQEFWENQKVNIKTEDMKQQEVGIASGVLAEMKPDMHGCNELTFNLTADTIAGIFKMYPNVKQKFISQVPHETSEKEFWTEFFKSHHFHRDRVIKSSSKDVFGDLAKKDEREILQKNMQTFFDPLIDFTSPSPNTDDGYGRKTSDKKFNDTLIKQFNHQSMMVLETTKKRYNYDTTDENFKKKRIREIILNDDLEEDMESSSQNQNTLRIDKFAFNTLRGSTTSTTNGHHTNGVTNSLNGHLDEFKNNVVAWKPQLSKVLSPDVAKTVLGEVSPGGQHMRVSSKIDLRDSIPNDLQKEMRKVYTALAELLRHFWACFPTKTPQLEEKVRRMSNAIEKYRDTKLANFRCMLPSQHVNLCKHIDEMIETALKKFNVWEERRNGVKTINIS